MRKVLTILLLVVLASTGWVVFNPEPLTSQATTSQTVLSSAVTGGQNATNSIVVASATGFSAGRVVYVDREAMRISASYSSGTTIPVQRGMEGTAVMAHASGAVVYVGPPEYFPRFDMTGSCATSDVINLPRINVTNGNISYCKESRWTSVNLYQTDTAWTYEAVDTNADYTATISDTWINFTDFQAARIATLPTFTGGLRGKKFIITAGDNVTTATITARLSNGHLFASNASTDATATGAGAVLRVLLTGTGAVTW